MGHIILKSGAAVWTDELIGSINLTDLIGDLENNFFTRGYRLAIIKALGNLGKYSNEVINGLHKANISDPVLEILRRDALARLSDNFDIPEKADI